MPSKPPGVNAILQAVERRGETDERPSYFVHVILPILLALIGILGAAGIIIATVGYGAGLGSAFMAASPAIVGAAILLAIAGVLAAVILTVIGIYKVMRRRERHFRRDRLLREGMLDHARALASRGGERADEHVETMETIHNDTIVDEVAKPPGLHLVLSYLFPLWFLHVIYYLTKDFARHAHRQARFFQEFAALADELGLDMAGIEAVPTVDDRSFLLSFVLLIPPWGLVGGFVVLYWLYDDPETHFDQQWGHEDAVVELVSSETEELKAPQQPSEETEAPEEPGPGPQAEETEAPGSTAEEDEPAPEPEEEYTVWECGECGKKYKVPPKRPVRVTCKNCDNEEILQE